MTLEARIKALEEKVEALQDRFDAEEEAAFEEGIAQIERGEGLPAREALEALRVKLGIPNKNN